jgi:hypothetical protein
MKRAFGVLLFLLALLSAPAEADESPVGWVNALRSASGVPSVEEDPLLSATAGRWAEALAAAGILSHKGVDGSTGLDRYRRLGGTEARVGEILGSGPSLPDIEVAWEASPAHRPAVIRPYWTHAGWGRERAGSGWIYVVLFCQKLVAGLRIGEPGGALEISGSFVPADAREPVLLSGIARVQASEWDPVSRTFLFRLAPGQDAGYIRLGYVDPSGTIVVTNALTLPRGTGSPGATGRFAAPASPP